MSRLSIVSMHDFEAPIIKEAVWFRLKVANVLLKHALANRETRDPILVPLSTHSSCLTVWMVADTVCFNELA